MGVHEVVGFGIGIGNGLSIVAARSYGAQDEDLLKRTVAGSLVIGLCASFVITTAGFFGLRPLLQLLDTPAEILEDAYRYIIVIDLGVLVMFFYNLCAGLLRAIGNSVMPLVFLLISSGLNVALDLRSMPEFHQTYIMPVSRAACVAIDGTDTLSQVRCYPLSLQRN
jgi:Na+-driven multidrug efflux pump